MSSTDSTSVTPSTQPPPPTAPPVVVNPTQPLVTPSNDTTAKGVIINSNTVTDSSLQGTITAPNQVSDYMAAYILWAAKLHGKQNISRVLPG